MIDNGQALLLPTSIFGIMLIYYLIRTFYKSNKNNDMESSKSPNTSDIKFIKTSDNNSQEKNKENYTSETKVKSNDLYKPENNVQNDELERRKRDTQLGGFIVSVFLVICAHLLFLPLLFLILLILYGLFTDIAGVVEIFELLFDSYVSVMNFFFPSSGIGKVFFVGASFGICVWLVEAYINLYRYFRGYMSWNELLNGQRWWTFYSETKKNKK